MNKNWNLDDAIKSSKQAIEYDKTGDYRNAIKKYAESAEILFEFAKRNAGNKSYEVYQNKAMEYLTRGEEIKRIYKTSN